MNLALAAGTLGVVVPAELPDKTFISAIILASKYPPLPVWIGTAAGLIVQAAIGVVAGRLLALLPHRTVEGVVAGLFLAGAAYLLFVPERREETKGAAVAIRRRRSRAARQAPVDEAAGEPTGDGSGTTPVGEATPAPQGPPAESGPPTVSGAPAGPSAARIALTSFGIVTLAEFGDLTQVIVANLTARSRDPWSVFTGAAVGFVLVSAAGVAAGRTIVRYVPLSLIRRLSGLALAGLGAWSLASAVGG